jgi:hypothetical protein
MHNTDKGVTRVASSTMFPAHHVVSHEEFWRKRIELLKEERVASKRHGE